MDLTEGQAAASGTGRGTDRTQPAKSPAIPRQTQTAPLQTPLEDQTPVRLATAVPPHRYSLRSLLRKLHRLPAPRMYDHSPPMFLRYALI